MKGIQPLKDSHIEKRKANENAGTVSSSVKSSATKNILGHFRIFFETKLFVLFRLAWMEKRYRLL